MIYPYRKMPRFDEGLDFMAPDEYYEPSLEERVLATQAENLRTRNQEEEYAAQQQMEDDLYDNSTINDYINRMMSRPINKPTIGNRNSSSRRGVITSPTGGSGSRDSVVTKGGSTGVTTKVTSDSVLAEMNKAYKTGGTKAAQTVYKYHMQKNGTAASAALGAFNYQRKQEASKRNQNKTIVTKSGVTLRSNPNARKRYDVDGGNLDEVVATGNKIKSEVKQIINQRSTSRKRRPGETVNQQATRLFWNGNNPINTTSKSSNASKRIASNAGVGAYRSSAYGETRQDKLAKQRRQQNQANRSKYIKGGKTNQQKANRAFWGGLSSLLGFKPY